MEFPANNCLSNMVESAYNIGEVTAVSLEVSNVRPLIARLEASYAHNVTASFAINNENLTLTELDVDAIFMAWTCGAVDATRYAIAQASAEPDQPLYTWVWKPTYGRYESPWFNEWLRKDPTLEPDGSRRGPCSLWFGQDVVSVARLLPPCGTGETRLSVFEFCPRARKPHST